MDLLKFQKHVGQNIRRLRKARGWTQFDMTYFGFSLRQYQYIESGERNISLQTILRLSKAFQVMPYEILR